MDDTTIASPQTPPSLSIARAFPISATYQPMSEPNWSGAQSPKNPIQQVASLPSWPSEPMSDMNDTPLESPMSPPDWLNPCVDQKKGGEVTKPSEEFTLFPKL